MIISPPMQPSFAFFDGRVVPYKEARVSVLTHGFNYGTTLVTGVRGYWNNEEGQLFLFRPAEYFKRLIASAKLLGVELTMSEAELVSSAKEVLRAERLFEDCYLRAIAYYSDESLGVRIHDLTSDVAMVAVPYGHYGKGDMGVHVTVSSWRSLEGTIFPSSGEVAAAYVNIAVARTQAQRAGFDEPILLDQSGQIAESPLGSLFILRGDTFIAPPVHDRLMESPTRRAVIDLITSEMEMKVVERPIDRSEIHLADEALLCGTGIQVTPVTWADHVPIGTGAPGKVTSRLRKLYFSAARRTLPKYSAWCVGVHEKRKYKDRPEIDQRRGLRATNSDF